MDVVSLKEMVAREERAINSGIPASALMDAAGAAMAQRIVALYPNASSFMLLIGKGNNGGDGLVVARHLIPTGKPVRVVLSVPEDQFGDLPRERLDRLHGAFANLEIIPWHDQVAFPGSDGVVIDALLGIQAHGLLRRTLAEIVVRLNAARTTNFFRTIALDLPTGLAAYEEGHAPPHRDDAVVADVTLAVGFAKEVLIREVLAEWVGRLEVIPWSKAAALPTERQVSQPSDLAPLLPRRKALAHKGDFGRLAIVAGSAGFTGAPTLCAQAALAMGAGLLSVITRPDVVATVAAQAPHEAMVSGWPEKGGIPAAVQNASVVVIGPGLGADERTMTLLKAVLNLGCPVVIDADGLNVLATKLDLLNDARGPVLLTPHPGEMSRLIGCKFGPDERESVARAFTERYPVTLLLKGTRTLMTSPGAPTYLNTTGNPGLSTGGSGDTLSGILGALLGQGLAPLDAARLGAWLHGHAADIVLAERGCEEGITPTMLSATLGKALTSLRAQAIQLPGLLESAKVA